MSGTILVTGATGTFGREVVRDLVRRGERVRAGVHKEASARHLDGLDVERVELDYERPVTIAKALEKVDRLFLLILDMPRHGEVAGLVARLARQAGVRHLVKLSAMGADRDSYTLGNWHGEAERAIVEAGVPYTFLRPNSLMQNFATFFRPRKGRIYLPLGEGRVSYVDARDVGEAAARILSEGTEGGHEGAAYELTGPEALSMAQVAETLSRVAGEKIVYVDISEDAARQFMQSLGEPDWLVEGVLEMHAVNKAGEYAAVTGEVERLTGHPARSFERFAADFADAFRPRPAG
jgi:uncharacterized protein YbjT (DUF2867 family)